MSFKADFYRYLTERPSVLELFGNPPRVFENAARQGAALPLVVYRFAGGETELCLDGEDDVLQRDLIVEVQAAGATELGDCCDAIANVLRDYDAPMGGTQRVVIELTQPEDSDAEWEGEADDEFTHTGLLQFDVWHDQDPPDHI